MNATTQPFVAIDFETANAQRHSACSVGMLKYDSNGKITDSYYQLIHPHPDVDYFNPINIAVHGIRPADVASSPEWGDIAEEVRDFISNLPIVAHNMAFDGYVLQDLMKLYGREEVTNRRLCTLRLARKILAEELESKSLENVFQHYFPNVFFEHHQAYSDAKAAGDIFVKMQQLYGYPKLDELCPQTTRRKHGDSGLHQHWTNASELIERYKGSEALIGERVCITGTLQSGQRSAVQELISALKGIPEKSLTKKTTILVVGIPNPNSWSEGSSASRKLAKAITLRDSGAPIQILSEEEFFNCLSDAN